MIDTKFRNLHMFKLINSTERHGRVLPANSCSSKPGFQGAGMTAGEVNKTEKIPSFFAIMGLNMATGLLQTACNNVEQEVPWLSMVKVSHVL